LIKRRVLILDSGGAVAQQHERPGGFEDQTLGADLLDEGGQVGSRLFEIDSVRSRPAPEASSNTVPALSIASSLFST
jgi:hypothetical protein